MKSSLPLLAGGGRAGPGNWLLPLPPKWFSNPPVRADSVVPLVHALMRRHGETGMALRFHALDTSTPWLADAASDDDWHLLVGRAATQLLLPASWPSLWLPLRGHLPLQAVDGTWTLHCEQAQLWRGGPVQAHPSRGALWLCLTGTPAAWARRLAAVQDGSEPLPWQHTAPRFLRRQLLRLAQQLRRSGDHDCCEQLVQALAASLVDQQRGIAARLPRCRGRTAVHRRQTLLRLLHVRHLVRCHVEADDEAAIDLAWLADRAHYSPGHLIRVHREVFGETPSEYLARLRSARAWRLVRDTAMPVGEITQVLGFESQSAFCRAFKQKFGMTATQARRNEVLPCAV